MYSNTMSTSGTPKFIIDQKEGGGRGGGGRGDDVSKEIGGSVRLPV